MDFIMRYLPYDNYDVVNGGIRTGGETDKHNLRYLYERHAEPKHTIDKANAEPYRSFRSTNFIIKRTCMQQCRFDERFKKSGYEDVHFGKKLAESQASIIHINNPRHCLFGGIERRLLVGSHPSLWVLNMYKLGYFVSLY